LGDEDGFNMVQFRQGMLSMNEPSKELERLVVSGGLAHGGHPVLRWMASNVTAHTDAAGNIKPDKQKSAEKIDGVVGLIIAIGLSMLGKPPEQSVYAERGVIVI
jgi:phage terminase large subunit-like protein